MARHRRLVVPGIALHVVQRGNDRQDCFREETDYLVYLTLLRETAAKTDCAIHAYCLMTNHVHILLTPTDSQACSLLMRDLGRHYVQYFNRRHGRTGTLWEGRFHSCLVDSQAYVLGCHRYIERNPVRAAMVASPATYPWSSYRANSGTERDGWLTRHAEYLALAEDGERRHAAYQGMFEKADDPEFLAAVREATNTGGALVGDSLKAVLVGKGARVQRGKPGPKKGSTRPEVPVGQDLLDQLRT